MKTAILENHKKELALTAMMIVLAALLLSGLATGFVHSKYVFRVNNTPALDSRELLPTPRAIYYSGKYTGSGVIAQPIFEPTQ